MLSQVYEPLFGLILPELCQRCGVTTSGGFCPDCRAEFVANERACTVCGCGPLPHGRTRCSRPCSACLGHWQIACVVAPLVYAAPLDQYLQRLKYAGERALGRGLGRILADAAASRRGDVDALVSVPMHPQRLLQRGYNQALEIARVVSAALHIPVLRTGVRRTRSTPPQALAHYDQRRMNLTGAFTVSRALGGRRLAIVDDVITTGATVNALAQALHAAGAAHVEAWAVARTLPQPARYAAGARNR